MTPRDLPAGRALDAVVAENARWQIAAGGRFDRAGVRLADRHYSRRKPGSPQFVKPGRCLVLITPDEDALWVTSWPFAEYVRHAWAGAWEPVLFRGGRNANHPPPPKGGKATTPKDFVSANITLKRGLTGAKPDAFCAWLFDILGARDGDELVDLFPGTGAVTRAWEARFGAQEQEGAA